MKKLFTLFAAVLMAVGANAQTEETLKFTSGNPDWGQAYVNDGVAFEWPGRFFESGELTGKAKWAGSNLRDVSDADVTFDRTSGKIQTYTIEFSETPAIELQLCVNCIIPNQWGGGHSTMKYKPLTVENNKAIVTVDASDCFFTGTGYYEEGNKDFTDEPQDVASITLQMCDQDDAKYPATISIKKITRVVSDDTGVEKVEVLNAANAEFVNAAGQKVGKSYKGLVINKATGKKFINK
ncbi:MAG: hypothetical protein ACI4T5_03510 [Prevotella sp.]